MLINFPNFFIEIDGLLGYKIVNVGGSYACAEVNMSYGVMANTGVNMNLGLHSDSLICIIHSAGEGNRSRIIQWYKQGDTLISTWMIPRQERGMEFKCMYSVYTGSRMNISIC